MSLFFVLIITIGNLRGIRESSHVFGVPTYVFILLMGSMVIVGFIRLASGSLQPMTYTSEQLSGIMNNQAYQGLMILLLLKAFSSGCSALTGIEAVSNAVPAFRNPAQRNARHVLFMLAGVITFIFGGTGFLALKLHVIPMTGTTVTAQIAQAVFGQNIIYYLIQLATAVILILAANTAYNGLPLLLYILAHDNYVPRQFSHRGAKLSFSNGIIFIFFAASLLIIAFDSNPHKLIPLYSVGVFISFTLSQFGMFRKWLREKDKGWQYKSLINAFGALVTGVGTIVVFGSKFMEGAWMLAIAMPIIIVTMVYINKHYASVNKALELKEFAPYYDRPADRKGTPCVVLLQTINKATLKAINYANTISNDITVLHICRYPEHAESLRKQWQDLAIPSQLEIIENPYRDVTKPLQAYVYEREKNLSHGEILTVIMIKYISSHWYDQVLHNQTTYFLERSLSRFKNVTTVIVPYHYSIDSIVSKKVEVDD
jgi:amino acid transporter